MQSSESSGKCRVFHRFLVAQSLRSLFDRPVILLYIVSPIELTKWGLYTAPRREVVISWWRLQPENNFAVLKAPNMVARATGNFI